MKTANRGGGRFSNCSMPEAMAKCERISGNSMTTHYAQTGRMGDHICRISDVGEFRRHFPELDYIKNIDSILSDICKFNKEKWLIEKT